MTLLDLTRIRLDGGTQPRAETDSTAIEDYSHAMLRGDQFPPLVVFHDGQDHWLASGYHRYHAAVAIGFEEFECDIRQGTRREAVLFSCGVNSEHGLRRTNDDKRRSVRKMLEDQEWREWSDDQIASFCRVGRLFVFHERQQMYPPSRILDTRSPAPQYRMAHRNGATYKINVANIGKRDKQRPLYEEEFNLAFRFRLKDVVYVIEHEGEFKIGFSRGLARRAGDILRSVPGSFLFGAAEGSMQDERAIHSALSAGQDHGEWFVVNFAELADAFVQRGLRLVLREDIEVAPVRPPALYDAEEGRPIPVSAPHRPSGHRETDERSRTIAVGEALRAIVTAQRTLPDPRVVVASNPDISLDEAFRISTWWARYAALMRGRAERAS